MEVDSDPSNAVFSNDQIMAIILENVSMRDVCSARLVNSEWNVRVSNFFRAKKRPLFPLVLEIDNSLNRSRFVERHGKLLDNFVDSVTQLKSKIYEGAPPPFSLEIKKEFFRKENYESLSRCFKLCGGGLIQLELNFPLKSVSFSGILRIPPLPILSKLIVNFSDQEEDVYTTSREFCYLLDKILEKAPALADFEASFCQGHALPPRFENIFLPSSLTSIDLGCVLSTHHLAIIKKNELPNLSHLSLLVPQHSLQTEALFEALESVRTTLKSLSITGMQFDGSRGKVTYLRFPKMEKLEKLEIESMNCELEANSTQLELVLPKLAALTLNNQTVPMLRKWCKSLKSLTVTKVDVHLVKGSSSGNDFTVNLDQLQMRALHKSFPNIASLSISVNPKFTREDKKMGLHYIFQQMTELTDLTLEVVPGSGLVADFWDSLLLGADPDTVRMLKSNPSTWKDIPRIHGTHPSIRNLKNLRSLSLWEMNPAEWTASVNPKPLISDLAFYYLFMEMPNLKIFTPDKTTAESWRRESDPDHTIVIS